MILKTKLSLGLGFLFLIIFTLIGFCSYYVEKLGRESDNILKDNYNSIVYARNMLSALDNMKTSISSTLFNTGAAGTTSDYYTQLFASGKKEFETNLTLENHNITEIQEKESVERLNQDFEKYLQLCLQLNNRGGGGSTYFQEFLPASEKLNQSINSIYDINMQAVVRKSQLTHLDSNHFISSMVVIGLFCFILALGYFWYFPFYISQTLSYLAGKMRQLLQNMGVVIDDKTNDEAFVILHAINLLENKFGVKSEDKRREENHG